MVTTIESVFEEGDLISGLAVYRQVFWARVHCYRLDVHEPTIVDEITPKLLGLQGRWRYPRYHPQYDPTARNGALFENFQRFMESHRRYDPRRTPRGTQRDYVTRLRRECKAAILFAVSRGKRIHFVLDGIDMDQVVDKTGAGDYVRWWTKFRDYTASELRSIYRLRHAPNIMNHVVFWRGMQQVPPPWVTNPGQWARYHPRRELAEEKPHS
jgi:hypothetical protein